RRQQWRCDGASEHITLRLRSHRLDTPARPCPLSRAARQAASRSGRAAHRRRQSGTPQAQPPRRARGGRTCSNPQRPSCRLPLVSTRRACRYGVRGRALSCFRCASSFCFFTCCCLLFSLSFLPPLSPMAAPCRHYASWRERGVCAIRDIVPYFIFTFCTLKFPISPTYSVLSLRQSMAFTVPNSFGNLPALP